MQSNSVKQVLKAGKWTRPLACAFICALAFAELPAPEQAAIDRISADSLRTNLSYLASDALEGRATPSHGLDLAADYIAAQFQRAGLDPAAGDSYFQPANFDQATVDMEGFQLQSDIGRPRNPRAPGRSSSTLPRRSRSDKRAGPQAAGQRRDSVHRGQGGSGR